MERAVKTDADRTATVLRCTASNRYPFTFDGALLDTYRKKLRRMLGIDNHQWDDRPIGNLLTEGHQLNAAALLLLVSKSRILRLKD
ncbi:MAG: hypothetical protein IPL22_07500 [Bacteroidetes bacterium]|nr:hypothetical protein [Bacteroidota bacterium]